MPPIPAPIPMPMASGVAVTARPVPPPAGGRSVSDDEAAPSAGELPAL